MWSSIDITIRSTHVQLLLQRLYQINLFAVNYSYYNQSISGFQFLISDQLYNIYIGYKYRFIGHKKKVI